MKFLSKLIDKLRPAPKDESVAALLAENTKLRAALRAHDRWEADMITNAKWEGGTPHLTYAQMDALTEVQDLRNEALRQGTEPRK